MGAFLGRTPTGRGSPVEALIGDEDWSSELIFAIGLTFLTEL